MNRGLLIASLVALFSVTMRSVAEMTDAAPVVSTSASQTYPAVSCTTSDPFACAETLQLAADAREQLGPLLQLGPTWRFPVHIHIVTPDDPLAGKIRREAAAAFAVDYNKSMKIEAALPSDDPNAREFIQRQFVVSMLWEKFFASVKTFDAKTKLESIPIWLIEGLRESLNEDIDKNREGIVRRSGQMQHAPTLAEVTSWKQLSDDKLLGLWQRSFCYYLVQSLTEPGRRHDDFQQWLTSLASANPASAQYLFPTEQAWQKELVDSTHRSRDLIFTWDETQAELGAADTITVPADKDAEAQVTTLDEVVNLPRSKQLTSVLRQKILELTGLELRAHASWHEVLESYRAGLLALVDDPTPVRAKKLIGEAREQRVAEIAHHQKLVDYVNWFQVTKDFAGNNSRFLNYFLTAQEMEKMEADPAHPNPIRQRLLQVESQLWFLAE